jgi:hypothetical protein
MTLIERDDVVQLAGDTQPLLGHGSAGFFLALALEPFVPGLELSPSRPAVTKVPAGQPGHPDAELALDIGGEDRYSVRLQVDGHPYHDGRCEQGRDGHPLPAVQGDIEGEHEDGEPGVRNVVSGGVHHHRGQADGDRGDREPAVSEDRRADEHGQQPGQHRGRVLPGQQVPGPDELPGHQREHGERGDAVDQQRVHLTQRPPHRSPRRHVVTVAKINCETRPPAG